MKRITIKFLNNFSELQILAWLSFFIYIFYSLLFYKERTCYTDSAYYIFQLIEFDAIKGGLNRFGGYVPQIPTYILYKFGFSLKALLISFSFSYAFIQFLLFLLVHYLFKNKKVALSIVFIQILSMGKSFFHCASDTHLAITIALTLYAWLVFSLNKKDELKWYYLLLVSLLIVIFGVFNHLVFILLSGFLILYAWIEFKPKLFNMNFITLALAFILVFFVKFAFMETSGYEKQYLEQLKIAHKILLNLRSYYSLHFYVQYFNSHYLSTTICLLISTIILLNKRKNVEAILVVGYYVFMLLFSFVIYNQGDSDIMMERSFMGQVLIALLPLFLHIDDVKNQKIRNIILIYIGIISFSSFVRIYNNGNIYKERISYAYSLMHNNANRGIKKAVVDPSDIDMGKVEVPWAYAIETLFLSTIDKKLDQQTIYILPKSTSLNESTNNPDLFLCVHFWEIWNSNNLNNNYFKLNAEPYSKVKY